jgi:hypothetical protein
MNAWKNLTYVSEGRINKFKLSAVWMGLGWTIFRTLVPYA